MIQLIGSAPRVSNVAVYSAVSIVMVRCGACVIAVLGAVAGGVACGAASCVAAGDGLAVALGC